MLLGFFIAELTELLFSSLAYADSKMFDLGFGFFLCLIVHLPISLFFSYGAIGKESPCILLKHALKIIPTAI